MSSTLAPRRPPALHQQSTSSSLNGMKKSTPDSSPVFKTPSAFRRLVSFNTRDKPLPPIPRRPSSAYSTHTDGTNVADIILSENRKLASNDVLQSTFYKSNALAIPKHYLTRPKLGHDLGSHATSDPTFERRRAKHVDFTHLCMPKNQPMSPSTTNFGSPKSSQPKKERPNRVDDDRTRTAEHYASRYQSVLHNGFSNLPNFTPDPYFNHYSLATPMSPRITDVVDQSLVPPPLSYSTATEKPSQLSRFSASSSEAGTMGRSIRNPFKSYGRKTSHPQNTSSQQAENPKTQPSKPSSKNTHSSRRGSRIEPTLSQRRASILRGISSMHENLADFSATPPMPKPIISIASAKPAHIPRERRSPAIPITPYQKLGRKAWELGSKPSKSPRWPKSRQSKTKRSNSSQHAPEENSWAETFSAPTAIKNPKPRYQNGSEKEFTMELSRMSIKNARPKKQNQYIKIEDDKDWL